MDQPSIALTEIRLKLLKLLQEREQYEKQLADLQNRVLELETALADQKNTTKALAEQNKIVKIADTLNQHSVTDAAEVKKMLGHYIREIDECLRLIGDSKL